MRQIGQRHRIGQSAHETHTSVTTLTATRRLSARWVRAAARERGDRAGDIAAATSMLNACQIAGPALLEIRVWRWLYEHPEATPAELRDEVVAEAGRVWDRFFRDRYGDDPYHLMAAYEHSVAYPLYLADYVIGLVMAQQIRTFVEGRDLAEETLRICGIGRVTPDAWMREAVGSGLDASPLLDRVSAAAQRLRATDSASADKHLACARRLGDSLFEMNFDGSGFRKRTASGFWQPAGDAAPAIAAAGEDPSFYAPSDEHRCVSSAAAVISFRECSPAANLSRERV